LWNNAPVLEHFHEWAVWVFRYPAAVMYSPFDFSALRSTLGHRNFAIFSAGHAVSVLGSWMQRVAVGWLTWELTHSAAWLGAVSMAEFLPVILLAPLTGVMADRFDRRRIALLGQVLATLQALALAAFTLSGHITPLLILGLQVLSGLIQPLIQTARLVLVPSLVPRENVGQAVAITSLFFNAARIIGPALSGVLIASVGPGASFAVNAVSYAFVIYALMKLQLPAYLPLPRRQISLLHSLWSDFVQGWRYTVAHPTLNWVLPVIVTSALLTWPVADLLAGIAAQEYGRGVEALAAFASAQGIGAILGGLFLAQRKGGRDIEAIFARCVLFNGVLLVAFALTKNFWVAIPLYALNGTFMVMGGASSQTIIQTHATEEMRGRTLSIWYTSTRVALALGALLLGGLASVFGFTGPLVAAGLVTAVTAAAIWRARGRPDTA
jgi:MFS family permease